MDAEAVADVFAGVLVVATLATAIALALPALRKMLASHGMTIAAAVAVGATPGSLYFSEVAGFNPCDMCWVQRIFMYPLAIILPIAGARRDRAALPYALALAVIGLGVSAYHVQLQLFPDQSTSCDLLNPCSAKWVEALGFATIPTMAGMSFVLICVSLIAKLRLDR